MDAGHFVIPAILAPGDTVNEFSLHFAGNALIPDYETNPEDTEVHVTKADNSYFVLFIC